jgi:hypothetical protein
MTNSSSVHRNRATDAVLWVLLTLGIAINVMGQMAGMDESITLTAGIGGLACGVALALLALGRRGS